MSVYKCDEMIFFSTVCNLYEKYKNSNEKIKPEGFNLGFIIEGLEKLKQLDYLFKEIKFLNNEIIKISEKRNQRFKDWHKYIEENHLDYKTEKWPQDMAGTKEERKNSREILFKSKLFSEHFYYVAFRLKKIIQYSPGLGKSFKCEGVTKVRNILIEHPEKAKQEFENSFALGNIEFGPILHAMRPKRNDEAFHDNGLFVNAIEFKDNLEKTLIQYFLKINTT